MNARLMEMTDHKANTKHQDASAKAVKARKAKPASCQTKFPPRPSISRHRHQTAQRKTGQSQQQKDHTGQYMEAKNIKPHAHGPGQRKKRAKKANVDRWKYEGQGVTRAGNNNE